MKIYLAKSGWLRDDDDEETWRVYYPGDAGDLIVFAFDAQDAAFKINAFDPPSWWEDREPVSKYRLVEIGDTGPCEINYPEGIGVFDIRCFKLPEIDALGRKREKE